MNKIKIFLLLFSCTVFADPRVLLKHAPFSVFTSDLIELELNPLFFNDSVIKCDFYASYRSVLDKQVDPYGMGGDYMPHELGLGYDNWKHLKREDF